MCVVSNGYVNINILRSVQFFTGKSKYRPSLWKFVSSFVVEVYFSEDLGSDWETVLSAGGSSLICGDYRINVLPYCPSVTYLKCAETYTVLNVATHTGQMLPAKKNLCCAGFKGCLQVNFWLKFLLGDNKMMTLLPKMWVVNRCTVCWFEEENPAWNSVGSSKWLNRRFCVVREDQKRNILSHRML